MAIHIYMYAMATGETMKVPAWDFWISCYILSFIHRPSVLVLVWLVYQGGNGQDEDLELAGSSSKRGNHIT
jgi:hypothetical protein